MSIEDISGGADNVAYQAMRKLRRVLYPHFNEDQKTASERIFRLIHPMLQDGRIKHVVDLGCGTGEILRGLYMHAKKDRDLKDITFTGLDVDSHEIQEANGKKRKSSGQHLEFHVGKAEQCFENSLNNYKETDWDKTIIICTGHTVVHFNWEHFKVKFLATKTPKYLFVDYFHTFDWVLKRLSAGDNTVWEVMAWDEKHNASYLRETKYLDNEKTKIKRSVVEYKSGERTEKLSVPQEAMDTQKCRTELKKLNYIEEAEIFYPAGYGLMHGQLYVHESIAAKKINETYHHAVGSLVRQVGTIDEIKKLKSDSSIAGVLAVSILPFDSHFTFSRYTQLHGDDKPDTPYPTEWMQLDKPRHRTLYPYLPAPSLYECFLGSASQMNVLTLSQRPEYPSSVMSGIKKQNDAEERYLKSQMKRQALDKCLFYLLPFYFGRLPLFCLIVSFARKPENHAGYVEQLKKLHSDISLEMTLHLADFVKQFTYDSISTLGCEQAGTQFEYHMKVAKKKKWKSWVIASPTQELGDEHRTPQKETKCIEHWEDALRSATARPLVLGSLWCLKGAFFSDSNHEYPKNSHLAKLNIMLQTAGITDNGEVTRQIIVDKLINLCARLRQQNNLSGGFFQSCAERSEIDLQPLFWLVCQLKELVSNLADNVSSGADQKNASVCVPFLKIKSVFCRSGENKGEHYRFSFCRLASLLEIGSDSVLKYSWSNEGVFTGNISWIDAGIATFKKDGLCCGNSQIPIVPTDHSESMIELGRIIKEVNGGIVLISVSPDSDNYKVTITVKTSSAIELDQNNRGGFLDRFKTWMNSHSSWDGNSCPIQFKEFTLEFGLRVVEKDPDNSKIKKIAWIEAPGGKPFAFTAKASV